MSTTWGPCCGKMDWPHDYSLDVDGACVWAHLERLLVNRLEISDSWWQWMERCDPSYLGSVIKDVTCE